MIRINLLHEPRRTIRQPLPGLQRKEFLVLLLLATLVGAVVWWYLELVEVRDRKQAQLAQLEQESRQLKVIAAQLQQFETQQEVVQARVRAIENLKAQQVGPVRMMKAILEAVPEAPLLFLTSLNQKQRIVHLEGKAFQVEAIADFIARLKAQAVFRHVELDGWEKKEPGLYQFRLTCEVDR